MTGPHRRRRGQEPARHRVEIRVTEAEYRALRTVAAARVGRGLSLSRFIIEAALAAAGEPAPRAPLIGAPSGLVLAEIMDAVVAVNRVGNNLNQLARVGNATGVWPAGTPAEVQRARLALERLAVLAEDAGRSR